MTWLANIPIALAMSGIGSAAKAVGAALVWHANTATGACYPSQATLAAELGLGERTVRTAITTLVRLGVVHVERQRRNKPNHYRVDWARLGHLFAAHEAAAKRVREARISRSERQESAARDRPESAAEPMEEEPMEGTHIARIAARERATDGDSVPSGESENPSPPPEPAESQQGLEEEEERTVIPFPSEPAEPQLEEPPADPAAARAIGALMANLGIAKAMHAPREAPVDFDSARTRRHLFGGHPAYALKIVLTKRIHWANLPVKYDAKGRRVGPTENHAWYVYDWERMPGLAGLAYGPLGEANA